LDQAILHASDPASQPGQYWKITTNSITNEFMGNGTWGDPAVVTFLRHTQRVAYVSVDGATPSWFVDSVGPFVRQVSGTPTALPVEDWQVVQIWTSDKSLQDIQDVLSLPRDPAALRDHLAQESRGRANSDDQSLFLEITMLLSTGYAPADLRVALFEVLKTIPGVDIVEHDVTLDGRAGVALGRSEKRDRTREELVFDPDTAELIGRRTIWSQPEAVIEEAISRQLVDQVDPEVLAAATQYCVYPGGMLVPC
jgi:RNA polymerase sigma-70 factor (ECF subfamily)